MATPFTEKQLRHTLGFTIDHIVDVRDGAAQLQSNVSDGEYLSKNRHDYPLASTDLDMRAWFEFLNCTSAHRLNPTHT